MLEKGSLHRSALGGGEKNPSKTEFGWILVLKWEQKRERQHQQGKSLNKKHVQTVQQLC